MTAIDSILSSVSPAPQIASGPAESGRREVERHRLLVEIDFLQRRGWGAALLVFLGYYLGSKLGFALTFTSNPVSVLWPPNSILLAALLLAPLRWWFVLLAAALSAHLLAQVQSEIPLPMMLCYFVSNSCEALIGAGCVRYLVGGTVRLDNLRCVAFFCLFAGFVGPFLSSFVDAGFVRLNDWGTAPFWEVWRTRFFSNVLTALTLAAAIVTWFTRRNVRAAPIAGRRYLEVALLFGGLVAVCLVALRQDQSIGHPALFLMPLPFLLWAALRLGSRGIASGIVVVTFLAIWSATHGFGPFTGGLPDENARSIQFFLIAMAVPFLFLGAVIEERGTAAERFTKAFRCSPDAMWITRLRDGLLLDVNEQWESVFGYRREEVVGRTTQDIKFWINPSDRAAILSKVKDGAVRELEVSLRNKDDERIPALLSADLVETSGEPSLVTIMRDLRDRRRAEEGARDLLHASRLAAVGEMTASFAHELNQPLSAIASNAAAGRRFLEHGSQNTVEFLELLADVGSDARRASDIIQGIRQLVRKGEGTRQLVNVNDVVCDVLRLMHSDVVARGVSAETELASGLPMVAADTVHLQQVVLNLVLNSLEAMQSTPAGKRSVIISTQLHAASFVCVSVRDHGVGVPENNPEKVFEHFYSTKPNGMGIGLTIVRSIVEAHGGALVVESLPMAPAFPSACQSR